MNKIKTKNRFVTIGVASLAGAALAALVTTSAAIGVALAPSSGSSAMQVSAHVNAQQNASFVTANLRLELQQLRAIGKNYRDEQSTNEQVVWSGRTYYNEVEGFLVQFLSGNYPSISSAINAPATAWSLLAPKTLNPDHAARFLWARVSEVVNRNPSEPGIIASPDIYYDLTASSGVQQVPTVRPYAPQTNQDPQISISGSLTSARMFPSMTQVLARRSAGEETIFFVRRLGSTTLTRVGSWEAYKNMLDNVAPQEVALINRETYVTFQLQAAAYSYLASAVPLYHVTTDLTNSPQSFVDRVGAAAFVKSVEAQLASDRKSLIWNAQGFVAPYANYFEGITHIKFLAGSKYTSLAEVQKVALGLGWSSSLPTQLSSGARNYLWAVVITRYPYQEVLYFDLSTSSKINELLPSVK